MSQQSLFDTTSAEWIKFRSVRSTLYSLLVTLVLCVGIGGLVSFGRGSDAAQNSAGFLPDPTRVSLQGFGLAEIAIGVVGVLIITSEYATGSIRSTLAATPRRLRVILAKAGVLFAATLVVGELCAFLSFFLGQAILSSKHVTTASLSTPGALRGVVLAGFSLALLALFAMGIGLMLRHTAGSITVYVAILLVLFLLLAALPSNWQHDIARFMPEVLTASMRAASTTRSEFTAFSPLTSTLVMIGYAVASLVGGAAVMLRRDA